MKIFSPNITGWGLQSGRLGRSELAIIGGPFIVSVAELLSRLAADWRDDRETKCVGREEDEEDGPGLSADWAIIELDEEAPSTEGIFLAATSFS